ncbi:GNAT family N-acetyltransferase [Falsirhodobacter xinxiangensis]|uniref:GNAT family N-acetyltransferase n=1 Tax=Falsirhodobacter xinxiangensis TaxID=2530049 RepID=UPI0010AA23DC|nr:GNAT family N-acetyltransferase [Rhodobacter xinxiangensis]
MRLLAAMEATWPPARRWREGPWTLRDGAGGGKRVSAATLDGDVDGSFPALVMIRPDEEALDAALAAYAIVDPTLIYTAPVAVLTGAAVEAAWPPSPEALAIWAAGGIGPARVAVMERARGAALTVPGGAAFVAVDGDIAMIHAVEVAPDARRQGLGLRLLQGAAEWAGRQGARDLALAVTRANQPARTLYEKAGMVQASHYHYRERG